MGIPHQRQKPVEVETKPAQPKPVCALQEAQAKDAAYLATAFERTLQKAAGNWELEFTTNEFAKQAAKHAPKEKQDWAAALLLARGASFS